LGCDADGDPAPRTRCHRRGDTEGGDIGDTEGDIDGRGHPRVVTRADGGRYVCRATNRHGVAERDVLVTVE
ncbi:ICAM1 protein, partial [Drymodes brunneopygia]|nr:ICAM1 protein [Drymodes brunneopygia]